MTPYDIPPLRPDVFMIGSKTHHAELVRHMSSSVLLITGSANSADELMCAWVRDGEMDWPGCEIDWLGLREIYLNLTADQVARYAKLALDEVPVDSYVRHLISLSHFPAIERSNAALYRALAGDAPYRDAGRLIVQDDFVLLPHRRFQRNLSYLLTEIPRPFLESMLNVTLSAFSRAASNAQGSPVPTKALYGDLMRVFKENARSTTQFAVNDVTVRNAAHLYLTVFADNTGLHFKADHLGDGNWSWEAQAVLEDALDEDGEITVNRVSLGIPVGVQEMSQVFSDPSSWASILDHSASKE